MDADRLIDYVLDDVRKQKAAISDALASGGADDYPEYRFMSGQIRGLQYTERLLLEIRERIDSL